MAKRRGVRLTAPPRRVVRALREFLADEAAGGVLLLVAAAVAIAWANSPASAGYTDLWQHEFGSGSLRLPLVGWVNDALMAIFFFVVGLEIKRELVVGELRDPRAALTPALAALGGVLVPAGIYLLIVGDDPGGHGWGVPVATDIAFAVGVLTLLGRRRVGNGAKLFLLSIAIVDDLIAITVIAIFYSERIRWGWLALAVGVLVVIAALRRITASPWAYLLPGLVVWFATYESGIHATVAGVALGLITPARAVRGRDVMSALQERLHPVSAFVVVPIFALANAGVDLRGGVLGDAITERITWAVTIGLVVGKLIGVSATTFLLLALRAGVLPPGMTRAQVWPIAALCGIGFTVALFIADLAFTHDAYIAHAKVGIFLASIVAALLGAVLLRLMPSMRARRAAR